MTETKGDEKDLMISRVPSDETPSWIKCSIGGVFCIETDFKLSTIVDLLLRHTVIAEIDVVIEVSIE